MRPIELGIGETLQVPVNLDTSAFNDDYTVSGAGIEIRLARVGSTVPLLVAAVTVIDTAEGQIVVELDGADTIKLTPGLWVGEVIDTLGPFRLTSLPFNVTYLVGVIPEVTGKIHINENVIVTRGEDYTDDHALFFQCSREADELSTIYAVIDGERYPATIHEDSQGVTYPNLVKVELDYTDTAEFGFTASRFQIVEVESPEVDPDIPEASSVNTLYDAVMTVREG